MIKPIAFSCFLFAAIGACSEDPITAIDRATDCADICDKYQECADANYNVDACTDRCEDMANKEDTAQIDRCSDCIDARSCTGSVFNCTTECAGIIVSSS